MDPATKPVPIRGEATRWSDPSSRTRLIMLMMLLLCSMVSYALRTNISIAAKLMMPELGLTDIQMGRVFSAFLLGYAVFQIPAGMFADAKGPKLAITLAALGWGACTFITGMLPAGWFGVAAFGLATLIGIRFVLGMAEAVTYPASARAIADSFPAHERAFANSVVIAGLAIGSAITPPVISMLMARFGWRATFYGGAAIAFVLAAAWAMMKMPHQHHRAGKPWAAVRTLLRSRNLLLLSLTYFASGYVFYIFVFWFYLYLVNVRNFGILRGGIYTSLPFVVSSFTIPAGGYISDRLSLKLGRRTGRSWVIIGCFLTVAILMPIGASVHSAIVAITLLSLAAGFSIATEGTFWSSATDLSSTYSGLAGGILNTSGNLGGVVSTALVPVLVEHFGWFWSLCSASVVEIAAIAVWLLVRFEPNRPD